MSEASYRLVIADDHPLFRGALRAAVSGQFADAEIAEAGTFDDVVGELERGGDVDLVLLDLAMPGVRGFSGLMFLRAQYPSVPVVVVSANDDPAVIRRCMDFGASGFIPKTLGVDIMRAAVARVLNGNAAAIRAPECPKSAARASLTSHSMPSTTTVPMRWRGAFVCRR